MYGQQNKKKKNSKSKAKNKANIRNEVSKKVRISTYVLNHTIHKSFKSVCNLLASEPRRMFKEQKKKYFIIAKKNITVTN